MPGDRRKIASKDSKPPRCRKMTETERQNKKRKEDELNQKTKENFLCLFSLTRSQGSEIELEK